LSDVSTIYAALTIHGFVVGLLLVDDAVLGPFPDTAGVPGGARFVSPC
jgi:hypothetical protein